MTQYPDPYSPLSYYSPYQQAPDPLAPGRRAAMLMFLLGGLGAFFGLCCAGFGALIPQMQLDPEQAQMFQRLEAELNLPITTILVIIGAIFFIPGALLILLGLFVRKGSMVASIFGIILVALVVLLQLFNLISLFFDRQALAGVGIVQICVPGLLLAIFGLLLVWLFQAARAAPAVQAMKRQYQDQYWQYQQYQRTYQQPGQPYPQQPPYPQEPPYPQQPPSDQPPNPPPDQPPPSDQYRG